MSVPICCDLPLPFDVPFDVDDDEDDDDLIKSVWIRRCKRKMFMTIIMARPVEPTVNHTMWTRCRLRTIHRVIQHSVIIRNMINVAILNKTNRT